MKNKAKCCGNCNHYNGECNTPESFQFESLVSEDYCCHAHERIENETI